MIGFAVYTYEGVGIMLPVREITARPDKYRHVLAAVMTTVFFLFITLGMVCYLAYGPNVATIIMSNLPFNNAFNKTFVSLIIIFYVIALLISIPFTLYPVSSVCESYLFGKMPKSKKRMWFKNIFRTLMVIFCVVLAVIVADNLSKFLGLLGDLTCTPIAFILPALFHYKLCAKTKY